MSLARLDGALAPVATPFDEDWKPDAKRFTDFCHWLLGQGVKLAVFGTTSEANSLSLAEKSQLLEHLLDSGADPDHLMPGTGLCSLSETAELTARAVACGCPRVLMLPPFYYKNLSEDGLFGHTAEVIERVGEANLQIYLYHFPAMSQTPWPPAVIDRLVAAYPGTIAGIKDSSGEWEQTAAFINGGWPDFRVFCGSERFLLQTMRAGGAGCISATANINPAAIASLCANWKEPGAEDRQAELTRIRECFESTPMVATVKAAIATATGDPTWAAPRPPLVPLTALQTQSLRKNLDKAGFRMSYSGG
ncbi:MAG: dihydrodipicolinate synthase family protein [Gammaproteobacteria bacterium]|nr:dihydrodipicolinate synthase family protein [Gammaproteobacteria bacterium]